MPHDQAYLDHFSALLLRGCIFELRLPRLCANRHCRRHVRCQDRPDLDMRCVHALHPIDFRRLEDLHGLVIEIATGRYPAHGSTDPDLFDREDEAIGALMTCYDDFPWLEKRVEDWRHRCHELARQAAARPAFAAPAPSAAPLAPAAPASPAASVAPAGPVVPVETVSAGEVLAYMKATLERDRLMSRFP